MSGERGGDIRVCNLCIARPVQGKGMHYCAGCMRFICTRKDCIVRHRVECRHALGEAIQNLRERPPATVTRMEARR